MTVDGAECDEFGASVANSGATAVGGASLACALRDEALQASIADKEALVTLKQELATEAAYYAVLAEWFSVPIDPPSETLRRAAALALGITS